MVVYLVSREHLPVFESLGQAFSADEDVSVLLDRRLQERRSVRTHDRDETRRAGERRRGAEQEQLGELGWVRIDLGARALAPFLRIT